MKTLRTLSIIGLVWFSLCFLLGVVVTPNWQASTGWGYLGLWYGIAYAIVGIVKSK